MELKEIRELITEIKVDIQASKFQVTYRRYETFFGLIGMLRKRNFEELRKLDRHFKNHNISIWTGKEKLKRFDQVEWGETITFRMQQIRELPIIAPSSNSSTVEYEHAGVISIADAESGIKLYEHQERAFLKLEDAITKSNKTPFAGLLVLPTGGGKTLTAAYWIAKNILDKNKKVLWVAHRHELLEQAKATFAEKLAFKDIFTQKKSLNYRIISGIHDKAINVKGSDDIIISSKDSLNAGFDHLYDNWIKNKTDELFLVIDEAHHATAKTYRKLIANIQNNVSSFRMLGLTATPFRSAEKEKGLLSKVFYDDIIYKVDLRTLIRLGILSEPYFEEVSTGQNFIKDLSDDQIEKLNYFDIDSIGTGIAKTIAENDERNWTIVNKYLIHKDKYKQTLVFALNVDNAIALNKLFSSQGIRSEYVVSAIKDAATGVTVSTRENKKKIASFRNNELDVLINVNILTEGTDLPQVQSIFLARPTISAILMTQMIGRGLRGLRAGGTKEAFIVSFIDDWQNQVAWINPEKLFIEENVDFNDKTVETKKQLLRLVAINKIEEFAILTNKIIAPEKRFELEKLNFISRIPLGIYKFSFLENHGTEPSEKNCEILVYDNIQQAYLDFIAALPTLVNEDQFSDQEFLTEIQLESLADKAEVELFKGSLRYPAYYKSDIKNMLQYYFMTEEIPEFLEFKDRERYDIDKVAAHIIDNDLGSKAEAELLNNIWISDEFAWSTFFNYDKRNLINEINSAKARKSHPELYLKKPIVPIDQKELRLKENLSLYDLRLADPVYEKWLRDEVFRKFTDQNGYYFCQLSGFRSKNKLDFQVDHIIPMHNGGLTVLENLQLLTRSENARKATT